MACNIGGVVRTWCNLVAVYASDYELFQGLWRIVLMGWIKDYLKVMWHSGAEQGKSMKEQDKDMVKKVFKKRKRKEKN